MTTTKEKNEARKRASDFVIRKPRKDITGKRFGRLLIEEYYGSKNHSTYWSCLCDCGTKSVIRYSHLSNKQISSCGCARKSGSDHPKWSGYQEMTGTFLGNIRNNAKVRNFEYNVEDDYLWELFLSQNRKCALSNLCIEFCDNTASLDRIDSNHGYTMDNVQWLHKDINYMKRNYTTEYFIEICKTVATNN